MARPKGRAETIVFSRKAVIHHDARDGSMCLSFRVADLRNSQLIGVTINALLVRKQRIHGPGTTGDGQHINLLQQRLKISTESGDDFYFLAWPIKLVHRIDESSPLWQLSSEQLLVADFEILVVLEANCEATGATTQVRVWRDDISTGIVMTYIPVTGISPLHRYTGRRIVRYAWFRLR